MRCPSEPASASTHSTGHQLDQSGSLCAALCAHLLVKSVAIRANLERELRIVSMNRACLEGSNKGAVVWHDEFVRGTFVRKGAEMCCHGPAFASLLLVKTRRVFPADPR